jgi:hypothetical protein
VKDRNSAQWSLLALALGLGVLITWIIARVDVSPAKGWELWSGRLWAVGLIILTCVAVGAAVQFRFSLLSDPQPVARWAALFGATMGALLLAASWLEDTSGFDADRSFLIGLGSFVIVCTWARPWWFWEHSKAQWVRDLLGDTATQFVYILFGLGCIAYGMLIQHPAI